MPSFIGTAAVQFQFTAASNSASREIPVADAVFVGVVRYGAVDVTGSLAEMSGFIER